MTKTDTAKSARSASRALAGWQGGVAGRGFLKTEMTLEELERRFAGIVPAGSAGRAILCGGFLVTVAPVGEGRFQVIARKLK